MRAISIKSEEEFERLLDDISSEAPRAVDPLALVEEP